MNHVLQLCIDIFFQSISTTLLLMSEDKDALNIVTNNINVAWYDFQRFWEHHTFLV